MACLDLRENRRHAVADNQVDLPGAGAVVALEQPEAEPLVVLECEPLAEPAEDLSRVITHA